MSYNVLRSLLGGLALLVLQWEKCLWTVVGLPVAGAVPGIQAVPASNGAPVIAPVEPSQPVEPMPPAAAALAQEPGSWSELHVQDGPSSGKPHCPGGPNGG